MNTMQQFQHDYLQFVSRRFFLRTCTTGLGAAWLSQATAETTSIQPDSAAPLAARKPHFPAQAKAVIFLHMAGAPSQLEMFEHKPQLAKLDGKDCPPEFLEGRRFAFIRGVPKLLGSLYPFQQAGESGMWLSDRFPHFAKVIDKVCLIHTMQTDQFNHAPAQLLLQTGNPNLGYPTIGAWLAYGLGSENQNMPGYVVLLSGGRFPSAGKAAWSSGFLPSVYQGVQCRSKGDPVLFLSNPDGMNRSLRERTINVINRINQQTYEEFGDPETVARIAQYEMAFRMQTSATEAFNVNEEPEHIHTLYGTEPGKESFANNCLLARRLVERGVRFVQLFDWGWDSHGSEEAEALNIGFKKKCKDIDQPMSALLADLAQRGLLDETLVVWGSEFGRTPMRENRSGKEMPFVGRDHHTTAYTAWMAGGGVKPGINYGETDDFGYFPVIDPVKIHDFQATMLKLLGMDHNKLVYPFQGLDQRLTGVQEPAHVIDKILA